MKVSLETFALDISRYIYSRQKCPKMNLLWSDEVHTTINDTRSRDVTRKRRHSCLAEVTFD